MKNIRPMVAFLLVGAIAINIFGYCFFSCLILTHKRSTFYKIMNGNFSKEKLVVFNQYEIQHARWEHEKEFELDNEMYDVVKTSITDDGTIYHCKKDTREDQIKKQRRKAADQETSKFMSHLNLIFIQLPMCYEIGLNLNISFAKNQTFTLYNYFTPVLSLDKPPRV